ncbi:uncharacterized protein LOC128987972 [Macrosteles quadrilineatus]|uniref:uncharacterized protein LOC128987972 n=1 Tax=Macrosteles quadrilineatus TaxID=74068 RepID=UPI0023E09CB7|nr:uncharacterized protein LOC128987972 [Macrosteles quadrilineatus]
MKPHLLLLAALSLCCLQGADCFGFGLGGLGVGTLVDNAETLGIKLPGYARLLSGRSSFMTNLFHFLFGDRIERMFRGVIENDRKLMVETIPVEDIGEDNVEQFEMYGIKFSGLDTLEVTPNTHINIFWTPKGFLGLPTPSAMVSVTFADLQIKIDHMRTKYGVIVVDGPASIGVSKNNLILKLKIWPKIGERCYLRLYDVEVTDLELLEIDLRKISDNGKVEDNANGEYFSKRYFIKEEGPAEEHLKVAVVNQLYRSLPKASKAICDNNENLMISSYSRIKRDAEKEKAEKSKA